MVRGASTLSRTAASFAAALIQRRSLRHAASSSAAKLTPDNLAELKTERSLRIKARVAKGKRRHPDSIIVHFQRHGQGVSQQ